MLNPEQKKVVNHTNGPMLCLAIPGSGKTRCLTERIVRMIKDGIPARNILAMTFTNKAANEMKVRVHEALGEDVGCTIITFHSFCVRILRQFIHLLDGYNKKFTIYDDKDQKALVKTAVGMVSDEGETEAFPLDTFIYGMNHHIESLEPEDDYLKDLSVREAKVFHKYNEMLVENKAVDFSRILSLVVDIFAAHPDVLDRFQKRFQYILVDEGQDTNYIQYHIVKMIGESHKNVLMVGDFNQSIYKFRGANPENIQLFKTEFSPKVIRLKQNYRSTQLILDIAKKVIQHNIGNDDLELETVNAFGEKPTLYVGQNPAEEADYVVNEIIDDAEFYDKSWRDYAIIYRTNALSKEFETRLRLASVPYKVYGGKSFYDRKEIKDFLAYLNFMNNPDDFGSFFRMANTPKRALGPKSLEKIIKFAKSEKLNVHAALKRGHEIAGLSQKAVEGCSNLYEVVELLESDTYVPDMVKHMFHMTTYDSLKLEDEKEGTDRVGNVLGMIEEVREYIESKQKGTLGGFLHLVALSASDDKEDNPNSVSLLTAHAAKGLEFPTVFGVGIERDIIPHKRAYVEEGGIEEERRLFYVLITRAKECLYLTSSRQRKGKETKPSMFIEEADLQEEFVQAWKKTVFINSYEQPGYWGY